MKIAFLVGCFPSLSETFILNQITGLIDRGHSIDIYAYTPTTDLKSHPDIEKYNLLKITHYYPNIPKNYLFRLLKAFRLLIDNFSKNFMPLIGSLNIFKYGKKAASLRLLYHAIPFIERQPQYDVIHCHFGMNGVSGMMLRDLGIIHGKLCTVFHAFDLSAYLRDVGNHEYDTLFKKGDLFLPISQYWQRHLVDLGCDPQKIFVHRMGIDCTKFTFVAHEPSREGQMCLVTVARLVEKKGVEYAIKAIAQLKDFFPNIEYKIVGDGPLRKSLENLAIELGVKHMVHFLGWQEGNEVSTILATSALLVLPSVTSADGDQEGIPVALMEAMAMGLPVLSTHHSGIPELIEDGISGCLVPERDVDALASAIKDFIQYPERWKSLIMEGRVKVETQYDITKLNDQLVEVFSQS